MKKFKSVLDRVDFIENKFGIYYAKTDGALYKTLKIIYSVAFVYSLFMYVASVLGAALYISDGDYTESMYNFMIAIIIFTVVSLAGTILIWSKLNIVGTAVSLLPVPFLLFIFGKNLVDEVGTGPFKAVFYYRHLIPSVIMIVTLLWMFIIALRAHIKRNKRYKQILQNIYEIFKAENPDNLSLDDWKEFIEAYNPRAFKELEE
ncbi:MAG: hypothetical protein IJZ75_01230 [Clostridia bacterium]|nr:hypothetical protein [Clostridia bacterium]